MYEKIPVVNQTTEVGMYRYVRKIHTTICASAHMRTKSTTIIHHSMSWHESAVIENGDEELFNF